MRTLLFLLVLAGTGARADEMGPTFGNPSIFTEASGAAIYVSVCAGCHMPDGRGAAGAGAYPALARNERLAVASYPIDLVLHGHGAMPAFGRLLTDAQVAAVVGFIRSHLGNAYPDAPSDADVAGAR